MHRRACTQRDAHEQRLKLHSQTHYVINQVYRWSGMTGHTNAGPFLQQKEMHLTDNHHSPHLETSSLSAGSLYMQNVDTEFNVSCVTPQTGPRYRLD